MSEKMHGCFFERYDDKVEDAYFGQGINENTVQIVSCVAYQTLRQRIAELERENRDLRQKLEQLKD